MESISKIKLKNQAGAITMLKGYVKVASDSEAYSNVVLLTILTLDKAV